MIYDSAESMFRSLIKCPFYKSWDYKQKYSCLQALFIWQFVRCNQSYRNDYDRYVTNSKRRESDLETRHSYHYFRNYWLMSEPLSYCDLNIPETFSFSYSVCQALRPNSMSIPISSKLKSWQRPLRATGQGNTQQLYLAIDCSADISSILKLVELEIENHRRRHGIAETARALRGSYLGGALDGAILHHYSREVKLKRAELIKRFRSLTDRRAGELQPHQVKRAVEKFLEKARGAPINFFSSAPK